MPSARPLLIETIRTLDGPVHAALASPSGLGRLCEPWPPLELLGHVVEKRVPADVTCPACKAKLEKVEQAK